VEERRSRGAEERREVEERRREKEEGEGRRRRRRWEEEGEGRRRSLGRRPLPSPFVPVVVPARRWRRR